MHGPSPAKLLYHFHIAGQDFTIAGEVSSKIRRILQQIGVSADTIRRVSVATYEAEMNVVIHAEEADVTLEADSGILRITIADRGPGIPDVQKAMQPGFSTASEEIREMGFGAGMGLPNILRCADDVSIDTVVGEGTRITMEFLNSPEA